MSEKEKYVIRVLEKLRDVFLNGGVYNIKNAYGYQWSYDEPFSMLEIDALLFLRGANVIDFVEGVNVGDDILREPDDEYCGIDILPDNDNAIKCIRSTMKKGIRITNLNLDKFKEFCSDYSMKANIERYKIMLEVDDFYFTIYTTYGKYRIYRDNIDGQPQKIFKYCYEKAGEMISSKELREQCNTTKGKSLRSIMSGGKVLDYRNGILRPFLKVSVDEMMVEKIAFVNRAELKRIQESTSPVD